MERLLHAYILTGDPHAAEIRERELAAERLCASDGAKPCRVCRHCRKVFQGDWPGIHPDVTVVRRLPNKSGGLAANIMVGQIRELSGDAQIRPNEADGRVYIFPEADRMNVQAQNALLKLLEEPPAGVMFLLYAQDPAVLLPTIRSRCAELRLGGGETAPEGRERELAEGFLDVLGSRFDLLRTCLAMEKLSGTELAGVVEGAMELAPSRIKDPARLLHLEAFLLHAAEYLKANVGPKMVTGYMATYTYDGK